MKKYVVVKISRQIYDELVKLKNEKNARSFNEVISILIKDAKKAAVQRVVSKMCIEFANTRASLVAWIKLLQSKGFTDREIIDAEEFLMPVSNEMGDIVFTVNKEKCVELVQEV
ncbi:MAG: hypothetical protein QW733_02000 [Desulfurococcaceae archaeon]|uniref:hypothetical protein n=1 Tax=Desulfurococcus sp. TaxID=51678 RepID=UPI0031674D4B